MDLDGGYGMLVLDAAERAGLGVIIAHLAPPRMVEVNGAAARLLGATPDDLRTRSPLDLVVPEQRDTVRDRLGRRLAGEELPPVALIVGRDDGTRITLECRIADLPGKGGPAAVIFLTAASAPPIVDLASDARYRQLVDAAPDGVTITRGPRFLYANQSALAIAGCTTFAELSRLSMSDLLSTDDLRVFAERTKAMVRDGVRFPPRDYTVHHGGERVIEVSSMVIDFEGAPAVLAFLRDVTAARHSQAELERTQRLAALGTLVAGVAHEVNNPLGYATLGSQLLGRFFDDGCCDVEAGRTALSSVTSGLESIASLVRELRTFARPDDPIPTPIDLADVITSALRMTAPMIRPRARLEVSLGELPAVRSGPGRLEQVFVNLLINAAQSFERADLSRNLIRLHASRAAGEVTVMVEDNGRGVASEDLPRIFDPFFTTNSTGEGTGLGLSISHAIVTRQGGRLEVSSTVARGTTVSVVLSLANTVS